MTTSGEITQGDATQSDTTQSDTTQSDITAWFDETYREKGLRYLRPFAAYPIFLQLAGARSGERMLDVACGPGHLLQAAALAGLEPTGVDVSRVALEMARERVPGARLLQQNVEALSFEDESFDLVTCLGAVERFMDRRRALLEMGRVTRDGGRLCLMVRNASTLSWRIWRRWLGRQNHQGHQDALDLSQWEELFHGCGLRVEAIHMDQWFRQRLRRVFRRATPGRPEPVARPILPLRYVNEFIFILRKGGAADRVCRTRRES